MKTKTISEFQKMIDVNTPIIYISDFDFVRVDAMIQKVVGGNDIIEWNPITGVTNFGNKVAVHGKEDYSLEDFLGEICTDETNKKERFVVLREIQDFIDETEVKMALLMMAQRRYYDTTYNTTVIIVASSYNVPMVLSHYVSRLSIDCADEEEISNLIDEHIEVNNIEGFKEEDRQALINSLKSFNEFEIDRMLDKVISSNGTLSAECCSLIEEYKKELIQATDIFEVIDPTETFDLLGGMEGLKNYLKERALILQHLPEALHANVEVPKGILIAGVQGSGKSLCVKAAAKLFKSPLFKLDMEKLIEEGLQESLFNTALSFRLVETATPCILWIDSIEKVFLNGSSNLAIRKQVMDYFFAWLKKKNSSVYVIVTANDVLSLPSELKRRGLLDEIFCVNLPSEEERKAIFEIHLKKRHQSCPIDINLRKATEGFNGADIEALVKNAVEYCFISLVERRQENITSELLQKLAKDSPNVSRTSKKYLEDMKKVFLECGFRDASGKTK